MNLWLVGEHHTKRILHPLTEGTCEVGRAPDCGLILPSQTVSRRHAQLTFDGEHLQVHDLGSRNGTRVNGRRIAGAEALEVGSTVEFGSIVVRVTDQPPSQQPVLSDEDQLSQNLLLSREEVGRADSTLPKAEPGVLRLLVEAGQMLVVPGEPEETFDRVLELVERAIPANRILILLKGPDGSPIQRAGRIRGTRATGPLMLSQTMVGMVLDEGASILTGDAQADERFQDHKSILLQNIRSAMAVPLIHADENLGALYADTSDVTCSYTERDLRVFTLLGQMLGTKIVNARLLEIARERERLKEELRTAANIQRRLLPQRLPAVAGYEIVGSQDCCEEVGGDLYDVGVLPDGKIQLVLGDVSGKGIGAALLMSNVLATVRAMRNDMLPLGEHVTRLDRHLIQTTEPEHYVTLFLGTLDPQRHHLEYVNAGHPPAFLVHADGTLSELPSTGVPVGLVDLPGIEFSANSVEIPPGATLIVYSDGIIEANRSTMDEEAGEFFGDVLFGKVLCECAGQPAAAIIERIENAVVEYLGDAPHPDDATLLVARRCA
jgi:sigma-B regulation protein RsbU (phosphoserine phosphatase)